MIYCPTCGAKGDEECSTPTGRDHPARRKRIVAQAENDRPGEKCESTWKALAWHIDWLHTCVLEPGHAGKHLCRCGREPSKTAPVREAT